MKILNDSPDKPPVTFGGADQWSNILAGADLIRRVERGKAFAVTTSLLVANDGSKFGKSAGNAIWLDPAMTSPYEFFQFIRNIDDHDIEKIFLIFTQFSQEEISGFLKRENINDTKEQLAFEMTKLVHGEKSANSAFSTAKGLFFQSNTAIDYSNLPKITLTQEELLNGIDILDILVRSHLCSSRGDARKLILGGGCNYNGQKLTDFYYKIKLQDFSEQYGGILIKKGKKDYLLITLLTN